MEFSSEGFDLDAIGDQQQQQQQAQESQDVIYEIGGGATRIPVPSAGATNQDNNDQNTTNSSQGDRQTNDDKVDADDSLRQANEYKEQGNAAFRQRDWLLAYGLYSEAIAATPGHPTGMELLQLQKEWQQQQHLSARQALHERDEAERRKTKLEQQRQRQRTDQQPLPQTTENDSSATNDDETTTAPAPREENEQAPDEKQPEEDEDKPPSVFEPPRHEHGESLAVYHCNRSAALLALERYSEAVQDCDMAILLNPTYLKAFVRRCQAHEQLEQYDLALADAQTVVKLASSSSTNVTKAQRQSYQRTVQRLQRLEDERLEQLKTETMAKLKDLGNSILGNFGLSLDNFKAVQDPNTGSYSISFDQSNNKSSSS